MHMLINDDCSLTCKSLTRVDLAWLVRPFFQQSLANLIQVSLSSLGGRTNSLTASRACHTWNIFLKSMQIVKAAQVSSQHHKHNINLHIPFCSFNALIPHIANKFPSSVSNRAFRWKSAVINYLRPHILLVQQKMYSERNQKQENISSSSESCWTRTMLL